MGVAMEYRQLGQSGLRISVLSLGTMTFGGRDVFSKVGATGVDAARRQVNLCLEAGVNLFDTANVYSDGLSEEILGEVLEGRRDNVLIATKARLEPSLTLLGKERFENSPANVYRTWTDAEER